MPGFITGLVVGATLASGNGQAAPQHAFYAYDPNVTIICRAYVPAAKTCIVESGDMPATCNAVRRTTSFLGGFHVPINTYAQCAYGKSIKRIESINYTTMSHSAFVVVEWEK